MHHHEPEFKHCPVCSAQLQEATLKTGEPSRLICSQCQFVFYLDPKLVGCSLVEVDQKIILLKRSINPQIGKWVLPGGYVDRGEEVEAAVIRETAEECGLIIKLEKLLGVYSYSGRTQVVVVYLSQPVDGKLVAGDETLEARLFSREKIPWQNLAFPSTVDSLKDYYRMKDGETIG
jgi:ADP-ribose pyrophosphatase YjhB (NUDIX family)